MKIVFEEEVFEGTPSEIIDQLRDIAFDADDFPDCDSFLWYMQNNFVRLTGIPCDLPDGDTNTRAKAMLSKLAEIDAIMIVEED